VRIGKTYLTPSPVGEGWGEGYKVIDNTIKARRFRKEQTEAERVLWQKLRNRELGGYKFRRQVPIGPYVVDFFCKSARLVIEVDGGQHAEREAFDKQRDQYLRENSYEVVRFWNNEILGNLEGVLESLTVPLPSGEGNNLTTSHVRGLG
jgi:very-short-patch-repair endonuclease